MSRPLSRDTKLKLALPILYAALTAAAFVATWPHDAVWHDYLGVIVTAIAYSLWITARVQLGNAFTLAPSAKFLVTTGLYSKLRHPVYYFSIMALIGISIYLWQAPMIAALVALSGMEIWRIREEEKVLSKTFGKQYADYKQTSWF